MKLKITVWGINYSPEVLGIGPCNTALCEFLHAQGHSVRMVTSFPYYPEWKKNSADRRFFFRRDHDAGVAIHRCWHFVPRRPTALKRIIHEASFCFFSFLRLLFLSKPDVFVVISPPLLVGATARLLSWLKGVPYVLHVQDLQPDAAVGTGMLKPGLLVRSLYRLEAFAYRKAACVSGISEGMIAAFKRKGVPPERILYFPNGVRVPKELPPSGAFRDRVGLSRENFVAVYSGNLGVKQGLEVLLEAARMLRNPRIRLIICGEGARRDFLAQQITAHKLTNVILMPLLSQRHYEEMLTDADVCLITQQRGSGASFFPSKLLSCLAFAKPVLTVADEFSELTRALETGQFGCNVEPGNPRAVACALEELADNPARLHEFSKAGIQFVEQFEIKRVLTRFNRQLTSLVGGRTLLPLEEMAPPPKPEVTETVGV